MAGRHFAGERVSQRLLVFKVSADGHGVVSHAGIGMLRELADLTGLSAQVTAALADTDRGPWTYPPGAVFAGLTAAVVDGADCIDGVGQRCGGWPLDQLTNSGAEPPWPGVNGCLTFTRSDTPPIERRLAAVPPGP